MENDGELIFQKSCKYLKYSLTCTVAVRLSLCYFSMRYYKHPIHNGLLHAPCHMSWCGVQNIQEIVLVFLLSEVVYHVYIHSIGFVAWPIESLTAFYLVLKKLLPVRSWMVKCWKFGLIGQQKLHSMAGSGVTLCWTWVLTVSQCRLMAGELLWKQLLRSRHN